MIDLTGAAGFVVQIMTILAFVSAILGAVIYFLPRTPVGKANERYVDSLEGEGEVNRRTISRLETDAAEIRRAFDEYKVQTEARISALERDIGVAKTENDRLRAENGRLHDRLVSAGLDGEK